MGKLFYIVAAVVALNLVVWGIVKLHQEEDALSKEISQKIERIEKNNKQILEMLNK